MAFYVKSRAYLGIIISCLIIGLFAAPHLYLLLAFSAVTKSDPSRKRKRLAFWQMLWARAICFVLCITLGIKARYLLHPDLRAKKNTGPFIIVSNHRGALDGLVIPELLSKIGITDLRSVMKHEVSSMPILGRCWRELGCAFLGRKGDPKDLEEISRATKLAKEDRASILIFPEGTRFREREPDGEYKSVLPPKIKGLKKLLEELPEYQILSLTLAWSKTNSSHETPLEIADFVNSRVHVIAEGIIEGVNSQNFHIWLSEEWKKKDKLLSILLRLLGV